MNHSSGNNTSHGEYMRLNPEVQGVLDRRLVRTEAYRRAYAVAQDRYPDIFRPQAPEPRNIASTVMSIAATNEVEKSAPEPQRQAPVAIAEDPLAAIRAQVEAAYDTQTEPTYA